MSNIHPQLNSLSHAADFASLRHRVLSRNIANVNTPNYQREDVEFAETFAEANKSGHAHSHAELRIVKDNAPSDRADGNNVDIDAETSALQQNAMTYQTVVQLMAGHLQSIRTAIEGA
ncbi:MAG: flagellar basal body rod protein FlgB [Planctomycetaceae bacterium]|nr:flagellar basal body rod protein FlgB [Planctomycetaceae bacterium]MCA9042774.1 flagellar basal body rod protein FlgB [Planctomycetaceae bacterium]